MRILSQILFFFKCILIIFLNQLGSLFTGLPKYFFLLPSKVFALALVGFLILNVQQRAEFPTL